MGTHGDRCLLLSLPAELRIRIYEAALAPTGTICLISNQHKRFATDPIIPVALLSTCQQIHREAESILYEQNTVMIAVSAHDASWPTISEARLPQRVLEKLQYMFVVLDCSSRFGAAYEDVQWDPFTALVSLKSLRLAVLESRTPVPSTADPVEWEDQLIQNRQFLLREVIERIPSATKIVYATIEGSPERELVREIVRKKYRGLANGPNLEEADGKRLAFAVQSAEGLDPGIKSGGIADVYAEYR